MVKRLLVAMILPVAAVGVQSSQAHSPPGEHSLQLLLGDEEHEPFAPSLISEKIRINVK